MANRNNETTTRFNVDISELKKAMQDAKRQIQVANSEFNAVSSSMDNWGKSTNGLQAKLKQLDSNLKSQKTILNGLESQYEAVVREQGEGSAAADRLKVAINNQRATINNTERQVREYSNSLNTAERAEEIAARTGRDATEVFDELADSVDEAGDSAEQSSGGFTVMKGALASLVADGIRLAIDALKDFTKQSIQTGMDFEASMSEVSAISGATGKDFELLENTAKEFGATTTFSASEAAQALKYMALAGWDAEKSSSALGGVLDLAAASGMDLAQASDMVTDYMSAFGMEAEKSSYFADLLAFAQSNANTSAEQLGEAFKNSAANLNAAGQDVETVTALLSMMANQGFKGSEAGTALTAIMRDLTKAMTPMQDETDLAKWGIAGMTDMIGKNVIAIGDQVIAVSDAEGNYRDLTDILKEVEDATNGMGGAERAAALSATFTADSTKGLNLLLNAGVGEAENFEKALRGAGGSAGDMADVMNNNLAGDIKQAQSALEDLQITAYEELQPSLREMVQYATEKIIPMIKNDIIPAIKEFISWIVDNKDEVIAGLAGIAAGFVAFNVVSLIQGVVTAFKAFKAAQEGATIAQWLLNAAMSANPIGLIIAAIAGLVTAFVVLWNKSEAFRNFWINLWENIKNACSLAWDVIKNFFTVLIPKAFNTVSQTVVNFLKSAGETIKKFFTVTIPNAIQTAIDWFLDLPNKIAYALGYAIGSIVRFCVDTYNLIVTKVPEIISSIVKFFSELPSKLWTWLLTTISKITEWASQTRAKATEAGKAFVNNVVNFIKELPSKVWNWLISVISKISSFIINMKNKASEAGRGFVTNLVDTVKGLPDKFKSIGSNIVTGIWNGISAGWTWLKEKVSGLAGSLVKGVEDALKIGSPSKVFADEVGKWIPAGIAVGIDKNAKTALNSVKNLALDMVGATRNGLATTTAATGSAIGGTVNNFYQTINSPKQLSRLDIYRQSKNLLGYAGGGL